MGALNYLEEKGIYHGDIGKDTIFFCKEKNEFKIYDQQLLAGNYSAINLAIDNIKRPYLAPEQVNKTF